MNLRPRPPCLFPPQRPKFENENAHGRQVAALALRLFDATHILFGVPAEDRAVLGAACLLHDLGYSVDPRRHAEVGGRIVRAEGLETFSPAQVERIGLLIQLHATGLTFEHARRLVKPAHEPRRLLYAAGLLRMADALDACHLQDAAIASVRVTKLRIRVGVRCAHFAPSVEAARRQAGLWREAFPVDMEFRLLISRPAALFGRTTPLYEAVRRLVFEQFGIVLLNVEGAREGTGSEALHDLRIAIRRMRTVLRAFAPPLRETAAEQIQGELQQLNRILGIARDLDVWIGFFSEESVSRQFTGHRLWAKFVSHQLALRRLQQTTVRRQLHGAHFTALRFRISRFLRVELPRAAAATIGVQPRTCVAIEDSNPGIAAAHGAGTIPIMVPDILPPTTETQAMCAAILPDLHAVLALLRDHGLPRS